jgi:hypothetical protein
VFLKCATMRRLAQWPGGTKPHPPGFCRANNISVSLSLYRSIPFSASFYIPPYPSPSIYVSLTLDLPPSPSLSLIVPISILYSALFCLLPFSVKNKSPVVRAPQIYLSTQIFHLSTCPPSPEAR